MLLLVQRVAQQMTSTMAASGVNVLTATGKKSDQSDDHLHLHLKPQWARTLGLTQHILIQARDALHRLIARDGYTLGWNDQGRPHAHLHVLPLSLMSRCGTNASVPQ